MYFNFHWLIRLLRSRIRHVLYRPGPWLTWTYIPKVLWNSKNRFYENNNMIDFSKTSWNVFVSYIICLLLIFFHVTESRIPDLIHLRLDQYLREMFTNQHHGLQGNPKGRSSLKYLIKCIHPYYNRCLNIEIDFIWSSKILLPSVFQICLYPSLYSFVCQSQNTCNEICVVRALKTWAKAIEVYRNSYYQLSNLTLYFLAFTARNAYMYKYKNEQKMISLLACSLTMIIMQCGHYLQSEQSDHDQECDHYL